MTIVHALLGFAVIAALLTVIPGLDTAIVLRTAVTRSRRQALAVTGGVQLGTLIWGVTAAAGVTALLAASHLAYRLVSLAGAVYLVIMGVLLLVRSFRREVPVAAPGVLPSAGVPRGVLVGLTTNLLNPKVGLFYLAVIPQFLPAGVSPLLMGALLASVHCLFGTVWLGLVAVGGSRVGARLRSTRLVRWLDRATGGVLIGFGAHLAVGAR